MRLVVDPAMGEQSGSDRFAGFAQCGNLSGNRNNNHLMSSS
jgi:hypothetical protein